MDTWYFFQPCLKAAQFRCVCCTLSLTWQSASSHEFPLVSASGFSSYAKGPSEDVQGSEGKLACLVFLGRNMP